MLSLPFEARGNPPSGLDANRQLPKAEQIPRGLLRGLILERAILDQFRIKAAVGGVVEVFEEDAEEVGLIGLPGESD
jgi:hypothetical protein